MSEQSTEPMMLRRMEPMYRGWSVEQVLAFCLEKDLDPNQVTVTGGHLIWDEPETPEQVQKRLAHKAAAEQRHREWVHERYHHLFPNGEDSP
jgi:hypothetical protein